MATKGEMEARIKELEQQVLEGEPKQAAANESRIRELEKAVDFAHEANERLNGQLVKAEDETKLYRDANVDLRKKNESLIEESLVMERMRENYVKEVALLSGQRDVAQKKLDDFAKDSLVEGDRCILDGKTYKILDRDELKWVHLKCLRSEQDEDRTVVILDRRGA